MTWHAIAAEHDGLDRTWPCCPHCAGWKPTESHDRNLPHPAPCITCQRTDELKETP